MEFASSPLTITVAMPKLFDCNFVAMWVAASYCFPLLGLERGDSCCWLILFAVGRHLSVSCPINMNSLLLPIRWWKFFAMLLLRCTVGIGGRSSCSVFCLLRCLSHLGCRLIKRIIGWLDERNVLSVEPFHIPGECLPNGEKPCCYFSAHVVVRAGRKDNLGV